MSIYIYLLRATPLPISPQVAAELSAACLAQGTLEQALETYGAATAPAVAPKAKAGASAAARPSNERMNLHPKLASDLASACAAADSLQLLQRGTAILQALQQAGTPG